MNRFCTCGLKDISEALRRYPCAAARIMGSDDYPDIIGETKFYQMSSGVLVATEVIGLPASCDICMNPVFGFHIHGGSGCTGNDEDPFADAFSHYNPNACEHPFHSGDLPPLFGNNGYALSVFLTNRFSLDEIIGRTIIIHLNPDDFTSQPAGHSGTKIACGNIVRYYCG